MRIYLPLHYGKAPYWLLGRMKKLAKPIVKLILNEFGEKEFFRRISDPIFFQSFSNVLGFDWNSSGSTTVLAGVLKSVINTPDFNIRIAGGKGKEARKTPEQIALFSKELELSDAKTEELKRISRLAAKVDGVALQDGYNIYHHSIIFSRKYWTVVQQGMNEAVRLARRYHWSFETKPPSIEERMHSGIVAERKEKKVMNLVADKSKENRELAVDIVRDGSFRADYKKLLSITRIKDGLEVPRRINWRAIEQAYNLQPDRFEDLLLVKGIGIGAMRALALIADLVYNVEYDRQDPAKYCFALGGKDGVPFPVDRKSYDEVIEFMEEAIKQAELGDFERREALKRLL
jgi:hypothetical protein